MSVEFCAFILMFIMGCAYQRIKKCRFVIISINTRKEKIPCFCKQIAFFSKEMCDNSQYMSKYSLNSDIFIQKLTILCIVFARHLFIMQNISCWHARRSVSCNVTMKCALMILRQHFEHRFEKRNKQMLVPQTPKQHEKSKQQ